MQLSIETNVMSTELDEYKYQFQMKTETEEESQFPKSIFLLKLLILKQNILTFLYQTAHLAY